MTKTIKMPTQGIEMLQIAWSMQDVLNTRPRLTEEQARLVLAQIEKELDANVGVNWAVIEECADRLFPET